VGELRFGYRRHPEDLRAVWGARLIAPNDLLWDRQGLIADDDEAKAELVAWLNGEVRGQGALNEALRRLARIPLANVDEEVVIYEDATGKIVGNTQASHGYVYVAGWLKQHEPRPVGEAFNDPRVPCCGRDAADCDCGAAP
jgi:hypothetical protein